MVVWSTCQRPKSFDSPRCLEESKLSAFSLRFSCLPILAFRRIFQIVLGKDAFTAGLVMLPGAAIGAILAPIAGRLLDKVGPKKPILNGMVLIVIGWFALALLLRSTLIWGLVAGHVFYMVGIGLSYSNMMTTGLNKLTPELYADGNAIFNTLQQFSGAVATAIVATIINLAQRNAGYMQGTILGSQIAMFVLWVLVLAILFFMLRYFFRPIHKIK